MTYNPNKRIGCPTPFTWKLTQSKQSLVTCTSGTFQQIGNDIHKKTHTSLHINKSLPRVSSPSPIPLTLSEDQKTIVDSAMRGESFFFTGAAGTGKSHVLRVIVAALRRNGKNVFVTASTGVAACNISGMTVHSFFGIGIGSGTVEELLNKVKKDSIAKARIRSADVLVIDEISMIDDRLFDKIETISRVICDSPKPFGGIQVILCGDFFQLPPVSSDGLKRFAFEGEQWNKVVRRMYNLSVVHRQKDKEFIYVLNKIRYGTVDEWCLNKLRERIDQEKKGETYTILFSKLNDVDETNSWKLKELHNESKLFKAKDSGNTQLFKTSKVPTTLELKIGAFVMVTKNISIEKNLANGSLGVVIGFDDENTFGNIPVPVVKFEFGTFSIKETKWEVDVGGKAAATRVQIPLQLAWAISIHKSQGMTLERAIVRIDNVFANGQAYVALSRIKSLEGLCIKGGLRGDMFKCDQRAIKFDQMVRSGEYNLQHQIEEEKMGMSKQCDKHLEDQIQRKEEEDAIKRIEEQKEIDRKAEGIRKLLEFKPRENTPNQMQSPRSVLDICNFDEIKENTMNGVSKKMEEEPITHLEEQQRETTKEETHESEDDMPIMLLYTRMNEKMKKGIQQTNEGVTPLEDDMKCKGESLVINSTKQVICIDDVESVNDYKMDETPNETPKEFHSIFAERLNEKLKKKTQSKASELAKRSLHVPSEPIRQFKNNSPSSVLERKSISIEEVNTNEESFELESFQFGDLCDGDTKTTTQQLPIEMVKVEHQVIVPMSKNEETNYTKECQSKRANCVSGGQGLQNKENKEVNVSPKHSKSIFSVDCFTKNNSKIYIKAPQNLGVFSDHYQRSNMKRTMEENSYSPKRRITSMEREHDKKMEADDFAKMDIEVSPKTEEDIMNESAKLTTKKKTKSDVKVVDVVRREESNEGDVFKQISKEVSNDINTLIEKESVEKSSNEELRDDMRPFKIDDFENQSQNEDIEKDDNSESPDCDIDDLENNECVDCENEGETEEMDEYKQKEEEEESLWFRLYGNPEALKGLSQELQPKGTNQDPIGGKTTSIEQLVNADGVVTCNLSGGGVTDPIVLDDVSQEEK
ncbi:hypothetical protein EIN_397800 [Entamoeba invadens IP1]|uniref:ATP-dependent DNA helicase n=1 Tax=Entamoeba invadens IP1 TaxID=370355 RepID=A0A0A1UA62_ENTIV|nr:hypothetical protein EIN_397800 [Entamoeba invadens IP1]ELP91870.1 hypothetical protein EIN_397800 [Entamoeba invadens IP1]|eukprot:XP_004258641.1 hypothetical protein EIN_397800 [Entamoeba invadens IP1]